MAEPCEDEPDDRDDQTGAFVAKFRHLPRFHAVDNDPGDPGEHDAARDDCDRDERRQRPLLREHAERADDSGRDDVPVLTGPV